MTDHYLDLTAIPQAEMTQSTTLSHILQRLHHYLPAYEGRVGISYPAYGQNGTLGGILRLIANEEDLKRLRFDLEDDQLTQYALMSNIEHIPENKIYAHVRFLRYQQKGSSDLTRAAKRLRAQGKSEADIAERLANKAAKIRPHRLPHLHLKSASSRQKFILNIKRESCKESQEGKYNAYGLSLGNATVPLF